MTVDDPFKIAVLGDSYVAGTAIGGNGDANWTVIFGESIGADLAASAVGGTGFVAGGPQDKPFTLDSRIAETIASAPDLVLIVMAGNDRGEDLDAVEAAARDTITAIQDTGAAVAIVGPIWRADDPQADILDLNATIDSVAADLGVTHIDGLDWFAGDENNMIGSDGAHPTDEGHAYLAQRIEDALREADLID